MARLRFSPAAAAPLRQMAQQAKAQLQSSRLLRWGLMAIIGLIWAEGLARVSDQGRRWQDALSLAQGDLARLQALQREQQWPERAAQARRHLDAQERLLWQAPSAGLAEAAMQDWLRTAATKAGLTVKDLQVSRLTPTPVAPASVASGGAGRLPMMRAHLAAEFRRVPTLVLLNEIGGHERALVVERLLLMPAAQPPQFELDVRAVVALPGGKAP